MEREIGRREKITSITARRNKEGGRKGGREGKGREEGR